eukprot:TRINITY_DN7632_c0_g1_i1.p1 TRINITY_DN7632_c0_g1~~TRINITY_DN7632_c0_g1_i1.p1  ORF type:complete len:542 (+),score=125.05 TRINITY_DN7632_c0_g1_i1:31-1656(+)
MAARVAVLLLLPAIVGASNCSTLPTCALATIPPNCGWCWQSTQTRNQILGARPGNVAGPTDGQPCNDWTWAEPECQHHVDCPALPDCLNILGTYCGWCEDDQTGRKGTPSGPSNGTCQKWVWSHSDCQVIEGPQQVHLAYANTTSDMVVTFASVTPDKAVVSWRAHDTTEVTSVSVLPNKFNGTGNPDGVQYIYRAIMSPLVSGQYYDYNVTINNITKSFSFQAKPLHPSEEPWVASFLVFGDMGRHGGGMVLDQLELEAEDVKEHVTALIHFGDYAYDLDSDGGVNGDTFMNRIEKLAANRAYMTCVGNHEIEDGSFSNYVNRFSMPRHDSNDGWDQMWHSWNIHNIHFISYSSEVYFSNTKDIERQFAWLQADLEHANQPDQRAKYPWIVAYGHRPFYCSNIDGDDCTKNSSVVREGLEDLFHKYGVDLVFEAHEHSYERTYPVYNNTRTGTDYHNPEGIVHLVSGAAGCNEADGACLNPIVTARLPWSAFRSSMQGTYSFGHLKVYNSTHLYFNSYVAEERRVEDEIWLIQESHGMRV